MSRSFNNASLTPQEVVAFKAKASTIAQVSIRVGGKRIDLPVVVNILTEGAFTFASIPPINAILAEGSSPTLGPIHPSEREIAVKTLKAAKPKAKKSKRPRPISMPPELEAALAQVPKGYRLSATPSGEYRLAKLRPKKT